MAGWSNEFLIEGPAGEVVLGQPLKVRGIADTRIKTDKLDARVLTHLLRADSVSPPYVPGRDTRHVKRRPEKQDSSFGQGNTVNVLSLPPRCGFVG